MPWTWTDIAIFGCVATAVGALEAAAINSYKDGELMIQRIKDAPTFRVGPDLDNALQETPELPYAIIRGKVIPKGKTLSTSTGLQTVMKVVKYENRSLTRKTPNAKLTERVRTQEDSKSVPFALSNGDEINGQYLVTVDSPSYAKKIRLLAESIVSTRIPPDNRLVRAINRGDTYINRGVTETERYLAVGSEITGIGKVVKDSGGHVRLVPPDSSKHHILSSLPLQGIVHHLEAEQSALLWLVYLIPAVTVLGLGVAAAGCGSDRTRRGGNPPDPPNNI